MAEPATTHQDVADVIEIRDPEVDVNALMAKVRDNVARRRAEGAYSEDLDAIANEVRAASIAAQTSTSRAAGDAHDLDATLAELNAAWMVREVPFTSNVPVLGPAIVAVRNAWNWMSTKWYVRPLLHQLVGFNALVVRALNESAISQQTLAEQVRQQQVEIAQLREEIKELLAKHGIGGD